MFPSSLVVFPSTAFEGPVACDAEGYLGYALALLLSSLLLLVSIIFNGDPVMGVMGRFGYNSCRVNSLGIWSTVSLLDTQIPSIWTPRSSALAPKGTSGEQCNMGCSSMGCVGFSVSMAASDFFIFRRLWRSTPNE